MQLVSVIVPVYKAESFLCRCIDSLLAQTFKDFEVILVDDGSPDKCGVLCDEYAVRDSRIRVIHKQNAGVAAARQTGLCAATGEYIIHVDADDWVDENMLSELYVNAIENKSDMVICDYYINDIDTQKYVFQKPSDVLDNKKIIHDFFRSLHGSCWNKLIKRDCIFKNGVTFVDGINYCEDLIFNISLLKNSIRVSYLNKAFYHYFQNNESIIHNKTKTFFKMADMAIAKLEEILDDNYVNDLSLKKITLKSDAFYSNVFERAYFNNYYPDVAPSLIFLKGYSWLTFLFFLSCYNYSFARTFYNLILKIRKLVMR